nr:hypothetical protein KPHV_28760 [Kitasatospora purpeofusca]
MTPALDAALRAETIRLRLTPQVEAAARAATDAVVASGYDHRPDALRSLTADQYRDRLAVATVVEVFTYSALRLGGQYGRAAAHLLHALDWVYLKGPRDRSTPSTTAGSARRPGRGSVFHDKPGLADTMIGLEAEVTGAAECLNSLDYERADAAVHALAARLATGGRIARAYATTLARHLVETEAQHLSDAVPVPGVD